MPDTPKKPKIYNLVEVFATKAKLREDPRLADLFGRPLDRAGYEKVVASVTANLPRTIREEVVRDSLRHLAGQQFTLVSWDAECFRLAGNLHRLRAFTPVPPWSGQRLDECVPVQILAASQDYDRRRRFGAHYTFRVLAGLPAGMSMTRFWTRPFCGALAQRAGFSKPWGTRPFRDVRDLVDLRFYVFILAREAAMRLTFNSVWEENQLIQPASCRAWNKSKLDQRSREKFRCPKGYARSLPCFACPVGLAECPAAVHEETFVLRRCDKCHKDGYFDPEHPERDRCEECWGHLLWERSHEG